jgi:hypothetical protein
MRTDSVFVLITCTQLGPGYHIQETKSVCCLLQPFNVMSGFYILAPENSTYIVRFQALMVASMKVTAFWDIELCILIEVGQHFRGAYCLHHQGYDVAIYPRSCHLECTSYLIQKVYGTVNFN